MKLSVILAMLAIACTAYAPMTQAQTVKAQFFAEPAPPPPGFDADEWGDEDEEPLVPARACRKMCAADLSPCDPVYFKTEDGRCDGVGPFR